MTDIGKAYWAFWSKAVPFGSGYLPVYPEQTIPINTALPYLTYTLARGDAFTDHIDVVRIWSRSRNIIQISGFLDSVNEAIPHTGVTLDLPGGYLWLQRGAPWIQRQPSDEPDIQIGYANVIVRSYIL